MFLIVALIVAIAFVVLSTTVLRLHPFAALVIAAFGYGASTGMPLDSLVAAINSGFGDTIAYIGIVIIAGSIIGTFLHHSGGAAAIAGAMLRIAGPRRVPLSMGLVGYIVSMPVYCDTGFVLLSPINQALARRAGVSIAAGALALSLGLYATHTMVPPTPGPVAAAGILHADLGLVIMWGLAVSMLSLLGGLVFVHKYASKIELAAPAHEEISSQERGPDSPAPSARLALLPVLLPIILIVGRSISMLPGHPLGSGGLSQLMQNLGQPAVALLVGVVLAMLLPKPFERKMISERGWFGEAIRKSALIIIITGAGGAFGRVLQESGIADVVGSHAVNFEVGLLLPFLLAAAIKTAQGSSTVAIVTTASIVAPLLSSLGLESEHARALTVVAIGGGSMVVSHANDSYFWVVTQFSGMTVKQGYQLQTIGTLVQGSIAGLAVLAIGFWIS
jgi:GntP family gluconate:H+ symporter